MRFDGQRQILQGLVEVVLRCQAFGAGSIDTAAALAKIEQQVAEADAWAIARLRRRFIAAGGDRARALAAVARRQCRPPAGRSEEHTSELQSLMRISYAVFCLNKKKT